MSGPAPDAASRTAAEPHAAPIALRSRTKLAWVAALYFASGFPYGLVNELLPVYLRTQRVDVAAIGHVLWLLSWPWVLKVLWAPLVDRFGTRKAWIIASQVGVAALAFALIAHRGAAVTGAFTAALFAIAVLSATQDVALDAYSIELLEEHERGPANGTRVTAYRAALIASGGLLVSLAGYSGWGAAFAAAGATMLALALVTTRMPSTRRVESAGGLEQRPGSFAHAVATAVLEPLRQLAGRPHGWAILLFAFLFRFGDFALRTMLGPFWVDSRYSLQEIGQIQGTVGAIATVVGAVVGGALVPRFGTFRALIVLGAAQATASVVYWAVALGGALRPAMWSASVIEHFTYGLATAAFLTYLMSVCERRYAATQFALLTAMFGLSRATAARFSGEWVQSMGYANFFLLTFFLALPAWLLLPALRKTVAR